jgi:hypothetical protein
MMVMHSLHRRLEPKRNQQARRDGQQMNGEIANSLNSMLRRVDIQHRFTPVKA